MNLKNLPSVSVIVTTYNWPAALGLTLQSIEEQSARPDQVIIADDGSGPETAKKVKELLAQSILFLAPWGITQVFLAMTGNWIFCLYQASACCP